MNRATQNMFMIRNKREMPGISIRQWILSILFMAFSISLFSQGIGIGTEDPDPSAALHINSTSRGFLTPRMNASQRLAISMPAMGLLVFDNSTSSFWYHNSQDWSELKSRWFRTGNNIYNLNPGNVGVGIETPTAKLDVQGTIRSNSLTGTPDGSYLSLSAITNDPGIILARGNGSGGILRKWDMKIDDDMSFRITDGTAGKLLMSIDSSGSVGFGTSVPHASAALDVNSDSKGFLMPRMTYAQRNAITAPAAGLMIYCTDCKEVQIYNGTGWVNTTGGTACHYEIGHYCHGGIVAYLYQPGDPGYVAGEYHGLIAAPNDLANTEWGCFGTNLPGCEGTALGTGGQNTIEIVTACAAGGIAAKLCADLVLNGHDDWFLPSKFELKKLQENQTAIGGFSHDVYWSSTEATGSFAPNYATLVAFNDGDFQSFEKDFIGKVRAIRYF